MRTASASPEGNGLPRARSQTSREVYHRGELTDPLTGCFIAAPASASALELGSHAGGVMIIVVVAGEPGPYETAASLVHATRSKAEGGR